jgi:putative sterol carrier protein
MILNYESPEFSEELRKRTNADTEFRQKAKGTNWKILTVVRDVPFASLSSFSNGELVDRKHVPAVEIEALRKNVDFTVEIPTYELSIDMAKGKESLQALFMSGKIKLDGSIFKALQYREPLERFAKMTSDLTKESVVPSKEDFVKMLRDRGLL